MILLDTNYLIESLVVGSKAATEVSQWLGSGERIGIAAIAWYEFLCGPLTVEESDLAKAIVAGGIQPFMDREAKIAANLFNATDRKRTLRVDAMIAGTAIAAGARLAKRNLEDFSPFVPHGLVLVSD